MFAADVDGDGDIDVLSASNNGRITWYENNGRKAFTPHIITVDAKKALSVFAADVDGDGDERNIDRKGKPYRDGQQQQAQEEIE